MISQMQICVIGSYLRICGKSMNKNTKIRFKRHDFKQKLDSARGYKRTIKKLPGNTPSEVFFTSLGLESWKTKVSVILCVAILAYLAYIPNPFTVKNIEVSGLKVEERVFLQDRVKEYVGKKSFLPKNNLLWLNKNSLANFVQKKSLLVKEVSMVEKDFPNSVKIHINPRLEKYLTFRDSRGFAVSTDGYVMRQIDTTSSGSPLLNMQVLKPGEWVIGQQVLDTALAAKLSGIISEAEKNFINILEIEIFSDSPDIHLITKEGYLVKIDSTLDEALMFKSLSAMLKNIPLPDQKRLAYVDMRLLGRAFVCYKNTTCEGNFLVPDLTNASSSQGVLGTSTPAQ